MNTADFNRAKELIDKANHVLILPDERIDGDSVGTSLAVLIYLESIGKTVSVFAVEETPASYSAFARIDRIAQNATVFSNTQTDLIMTFDCSDGKYIHGLAKKLQRRVPIINIDHHATNALYGDVNIVDTSACATAEVAY